MSDDKNKKDHSMKLVQSMVDSVKELGTFNIKYQ